MNLNELVDLLKDLERSRFFGKIEIAYQNGRCTAVYKHETLKAAHIETPIRDHRGNNGQHFYTK